MAALALRQNEFDTALNILAGDTREEEQFFVTIRQIRMVAWCRTGQFDAVNDLIWTLLEKHEKNPRFSPATSIDVINVIEECLKEAGTHKQCTDFNDLREELVKKKMISNAVREC